MSRALVYDKYTETYEKQTDSVKSKSKKEVIKDNIDKFNKMTRRTK